MKTSKIAVLLITTLIILILSISANFYSFNKLSTQQKEQPTAIQDDELVTQKPSTSTTKFQDVETEDSTQANLNDEKSLKNSAERFLDFSFNVNPDNYVSAKKNAKKYMTNELFEIIFPSDGIDPDFKMNIDNVQIFTSDRENEVVAIYQSNLETYETKELSELKDKVVTNKSINYVLIKLEREGDEYKVNSFTPIKVEERKDNEQ